MESGSLPSGHASQRANTMRKENCLSRRSFQLLIFLPTGKLVSFVDAAPEEFLKYQPQSPFPLSILKKASLGEIKPSNHCLASQSINTS